MDEAQRRLEFLAAIAEELNRHLELEPMLERVLPLLASSLGVQTAWVILLEGDQFSLAGAHGLPSALEADGRAALRWSPCRCQRMLLAGELTRALHVVDCERLERVYSALAAAQPEEADRQTGGLKVHWSMPLRAGEKAVGILNVARPGDDPPDPQVGVLLEAVAVSLGVAIERAQLHAELAGRRQKEALTQLGQTLLGARSLEDVGAAVFPVLREHLKPDAVSLLVVDPTRTALDLVAAEGWSRKYIGRLRLPLQPPESSGPSWALHTGTPVVEDHTSPSCPFSVPEVVRQAGVRVCVNLPMLSAAGPTGVLVLDYLKARTLADDQLRFAALVAGVAALAVERVLEHERNRLLFEGVPVGLYRSTPAGQILDVNGALVRILGYPDADTLRRTNAALLYVNAEDRRRWQLLLDREGVVTGFEVPWRRYDGSVIWVRETARVIRDESGRPVYYEGSVEDVTGRKQFEAQLFYLASHDPLTGVYNRRRLEEELGRLLGEARRYGQQGALLFLDLDNFKEVNDRLGFRTGDDLLRGVARILRSRVREADIVGRVGGDEFGVLLYPTEASQALQTAERILEAVQGRVVLVGGRWVRLTCSCGVALFPEHGVTVDEVLACADISLHLAKDRGGNRVVLYTPGEATQPAAAGQWGERLARALQEDLFALYAQPIVNVRTGVVCAYELLVRLADVPEVVPPGGFLPAAERLNLVRAIDRWVWRQAIALARDRKFRLHVNLSGKTVGDEEAIRDLVADLDTLGAPAAQLVVELTETAAVGDLDRTLRCIEALRAHGCRFALDDFGAGFSSLYYLRNLPVDILKIDGSFVRELARDGQARHIVRAIAELARGLGRETVAEWVEDDLTLQMVRELGVDYAQGYHLGRPVPVSEL